MDELTYDLDSDLAMDYGKRLRSRAWFHLMRNIRALHTIGFHDEAKDLESACAILKTKGI